MSNQKTLNNQNRADDAKVTLADTIGTGISSAQQTLDSAQIIVAENLDTVKKSSEGAVEDLEAAKNKLVNNNATWADVVSGKASSVEHADDSAKKNLGENTNQITEKTQDVLTENANYVFNQFQGNAESAAKTTEENHSKAKDSATKNVGENLSFVEDKVRNTAQDVKDSAPVNYIDVIKNTESATKDKEGVSNNLNYATDRATEDAQWAKNVVTENLNYAKDKADQAVQTGKTNSIPSITLSTQDLPLPVVEKIETYLPLPDATRQELSRDLELAEKRVKETNDFAKTRAIENLNYALETAEKMKEDIASTQIKPDTTIQGAAVAVQENAAAVTNTLVDNLAYVKDVVVENAEKMKEDIASTQIKPDTTIQDAATTVQDAAVAVQENAAAVTNTLVDNLTYFKDVVVENAVAMKETLLPGFKLVKDPEPYVLKAPVQTPSQKIKEMHERTLADEL